MNEIPTSDSNHPAEPAPRFRFRWFISIAAFVFLLVSAAAALLFTHWPFSQQKVTQALQSSFPATVTFGSFRSIYFPHPGCEGTNVVFKGNGPPDGTPPMVTVEKFRIEAHYLDLLVRPGYLAKLVVIGFHIHVPPLGSSHQKSGWNSGSSTARIGEVVADGAVVEIARADGHDPLVFAIHSAKLTSVG